MSILQLNPPLLLETPKGTAVCHFLEMRGEELDPLWGCFQEDGQIWWWPNPKIRAIRNFTQERYCPEKPPTFAQLKEAK